jgi:hypothetical protein
VKLGKRLAASCAAVGAVIFLGAGSAHAQDEGGLLDLLGNPSITLFCFPVGQMGHGNTVGGNQTVSCSQTATQTNTTPAPTPTPPNGNGGVTGREVVEAEPTTVEPNTGNSSRAECPAGKVATGGGYIASSNLRVGATVPLATPAQGWGASADNISQTDGSIRAYVVCVNGTAA